MTNEEIKQRINLRDLANHFGIKRHGVNYHSPFKGEFDKSPSLSIHKEYFKDFSTDLKGDCFRFVELINNCDFIEAKRYLLDFLGERVTNNNFNPVKHTAIQQDSEPVLFTDSDLLKERAGIISESFPSLSDDDLHSKAVFSVKFHIFEVLKGLAISEGMTSEAVNYLTGSRCLSLETIRKYGIFEIKQSTVIKLKSLYNLNDLKAAGLINDKGNFIFFYHTLAIPYYFNSCLYHIKARTLLSSNKLKYIQANKNGLRSDLFFNVDTLETVKPGETLYITEGEFDCILAEQTGFKALSVWSSSTLPGIIPNILKELDVRIITDNDEAGDKAATKLIDKLQAKGITATRFLFPPGVKDLTDLFIKLKETERQ